MTPDTGLESVRKVSRTGDSASGTGSESGDAVSAGDDRDDRRQLTWWLALCSPLVVPWVVVLTTSATLVFPWGMVAVEGWYVTSLPDFLASTSGLPRHLEVWPLGSLCYGFAFAWAVGERIGADQRVTAGLLVLAAIAAVWMGSGLGVEPNRRAIPLGSILLFALALWAYVRA
ncbi:TIGR04206 family protein [Halomontanus rarus]|uniref:TIGR04206 family protein n=1 Tax=Halomontanus rarus TaxID=3034020 RepID=UPI0023E88F00|nr:TIGR04206 family protein [Halovivax sp. TS33]